ncbi:MAG: FKBP-type peptidyl-prolyl cis-trans isomerase [Gammaproteobacteria bacterium]|nr:FKBP-type peptidyl-prolyl cis-trans isomerase [Gammaproteobacteria bacterium]
MLFITLISLPFSVLAADKPDTSKERISYTLGIQLGQNFKQDNIDLDLDHFVQALEDVLQGRQSKLSNQEMQQAMMALREQKQKEMAKLAEDNKKAGAAFMDKNRKADGVKETASGLQYKVIKPGDGAKPTLQDTVTVHYRGTLIDGTVFDSSYKRGEPATFPLQGVIKGWQEALQMMKVGGKWMVYIPANLAYGAQAAGPTIPPNSTLVFEVELLDIK